jgi:ATP-binding cassette subfamily A (ABC1) protein 3
MSSGKVKCSGTPLFLKESYGSGYTLTIVKDFRSTDAAIVEAIKAHVPDAVVSSSAGAELALRLPLKASAAFPAMLLDLETRSAPLGIRTMGACRGSRS